MNSMKAKLLFALAVVFAFGSALRAQTFIPPLSRNPKTLVTELASASEHVRAQASLELRAHFKEHPEVTARLLVRELANHDAATHLHTPAGASYAGDEDNIRDESDSSGNVLQRAYISDVLLLFPEQSATALVQSIQNSLLNDHLATVQFRSFALQSLNQKATAASAKFKEIVSAAHIRVSRNLESELAKETKPARFQPQTSQTVMSPRSARRPPSLPPASDEITEEPDNQLAESLRTKKTVLADLLRVMGDATPVEADFVQPLRPGVTPRSRRQMVSRLVDESTDGLRSGAVTDARYQALSLQELVDVLLNSHRSDPISRRRRAMILKIIATRGEQAAPAHKHLFTVLVRDESAEIRKLAASVLRQTGCSGLWIEHEIAQRYQPVSQTAELARAWEAFNSLGDKKTTRRLNTGIQNLKSPYLPQHSEKWLELLASEDSEDQEWALLILSVMDGKLAAKALPQLRAIMFDPREPLKQRIKAAQAMINAHVATSDRPSRVRIREILTCALYLEERALHEGAARALLRSYTAFGAHTNRLAKICSAELEAGGRRREKMLDFINDEERSVEFTRSITPGLLHCIGDTQLKPEFERAAAHVLMNCYHREGQFEDNHFAALLAAVRRCDNQATNRELMAFVISSKVRTARLRSTVSRKSDGSHNELIISEACIAELKRRNQLEGLLPQVKATANGFALLIDRLEKHVSTADEAAKSNRLSIPEFANVHSQLPVMSFVAVCNAIASIDQEAAHEVEFQAAMATGLPILRHLYLNSLQLTSEPNPANAARVRTLIREFPRKGELRIPSLIVNHYLALAHIEGKIPGDLFLQALKEDQFAGAEYGITLLTPYVDCSAAQVYPELLEMCDNAIQGKHALGIPIIQAVAAHATVLNGMERNWSDAGSQKYLTAATCKKIRIHMKRIQEQLGATRLAQKPDDRLAYHFITSTALTYSLDADGAFVPDASPPGGMPDPGDVTLVMPSMQLIPNASESSSPITPEALLNGLKPVFRRVEQHLQRYEKNVQQQQAERDEAAWREFFQQPTVQTALAGVAWVVGWGLLALLLWVFRPGLLLPLGQLANNANVKLWGFELTLGHAIGIGFLTYNTRTLDAWVRQHLREVRDVFGSSKTVEDRALHVSMPVVTPQGLALQPDQNDFATLFSGNVNNVVIAGEGGCGKTSLACELGRRACSADREQRLTKHAMIPILIEDDIPGNDRLQAMGDANLSLDAAAVQQIVAGHDARLIEVVRGKLMNLTKSTDDIPAGLVEQLLRQRRILLIVDSFSELKEESRKVIEPARTGFPAKALVVTSRKAERLGGADVKTVRPQRVNRAQLLPFVIAYLEHNGAYSDFAEDSEVDLLQRLKLLVGQREITMLVARMFLDSEIGAARGETDSDQPANVPELMAHYISWLNRKLDGEPLPDPALLECAQKLAWRCLSDSYKPGSTASAQARESLAGSARELKRLEQLGVVVQRGVVNREFRFSLDPLAEYLAAQHLVNRAASEPATWREFFEDFDAKPAQTEGENGFLLALLDCVNQLRATDNQNGSPPSDVIDDIRKRLHGETHPPDGVVPAGSDLKAA